MSQPCPAARRRFLHHTLRLAAVAAVPVGARASIPAPGARALAFAHTHTQERIEIVYAQDDRYLPQALASLNRFLRDHNQATLNGLNGRGGK